MNIQISAEAIRRHYDKLNRMGVYQGDIALGYHRPAYSQAETEVMMYVELEALDAGLDTRWDAVGNLIVETQYPESDGEFNSWVETGSHVDTVPGGGNFDGLAGVVAGLEVLMLVQKQQMILKHGLRLRVWRGEESSTFGTASLGAWAAVGQLEPEVLHRTFQGESMAKAMKNQGAEPKCVQNQIPTISQAELDTIVAHIELHIEQGTVLEKQACDIGVVTGIRGSLRSWVRIKGVFDHSGATPMGKIYRKDANLAMAHMMVALDHLLQRYNGDEAKVVQTFGAINTHGNHNQRFPLVHENAMTKVSGFAYFSLEVRSCSHEQAVEYEQQALDLIQDIAQRFGVEVEIESISASIGVPALDKIVQQKTIEVCRQQQRSFTTLASGAWHDVAVITHQRKSDGSSIPTGMIFTPCRAGISHSAAEYTSAEHIATGASVLAEVMLGL